MLNPNSQIVAPITVTTSTCCGDLPNADHDRCSFCGEKARFAETDIEDYVRGTRGDGTQPRHPDFDGDEQAEALWTWLMDAKLAGGLVAKRELAKIETEQSEDTLERLREMDGDAEQAMMLELDNADMLQDRKAIWNGGYPF